MLTCLVHFPLLKASLPRRSKKGERPGHPVIVSMANNQLRLCLVPMHFIHAFRASLIFPYQIGANGNFFIGRFLALRGFIHLGAVSGIKFQIMGRNPLGYGVKPDQKVHDNRYFEVKAARSLLAPDFSR